MSIAYRHNRKKTRLRLHELEDALYGTVPKNFQAIAQGAAIEIGQVRRTITGLLTRNLWGRIKWLALGR